MRDCVIGQRGSQARVKDPFAGGQDAQRRDDLVDFGILEQTTFCAGRQNLPPALLK